MRPIARLLRPRSVAVFGAAWARETIRQMRRFGYDGAIWPVHPEKREIEGLVAYPSLDELPQPPDAAYIGVNRHQTIKLVGELSRRGAGGAVCFASGFAETGAEGAELQRALVAAAADMPVLGPNCYGFINALDRALLWPDMHGCLVVDRGVAIIAQSSNIAINLTMARRALPIGYVLCLGNQAQIGLPQAIEAMAEDPRVSVIVLHIEAIADAPAFAHAAARARAAGKAIVALAAGRTERSRDMVASHTASLAGASAVLSAFLMRVGVAEVDTIPELLEAAKLLHVLGPLGEGGLVTLSCSGGEASLVADHAARAGVNLANFSEERVAAIRATVNPLVHVANPFDYHTFDWGAGDRLAGTFTETMHGAQAVTGLVLDYPKAELGPPEGWDIAFDAFTQATRATGGKALVIATVPECLPQDRAERLIGEGVAPMQGLSETMAAVRAAVAAGREVAPFAPPRSAPTGTRRLLDEAQAKARLAAHGVAIPEGEVCSSREVAVVAALRLAPAAMKAVGAEIAHKTELGAVKLNIATREVAEAAYNELSRLSPRVLVERMAEGAVVELIVGAARDPALGLHLIVGAGGVLAELIADRAILMLPASEAEVRAALGGLKIGRLLEGYRGRPAANVNAVVGVILRIADFAVANADTLEELDVNPLIATRDGAIAVDALIALREPP